MILSAKSPESPSNNNNDNDTIIITRHFKDE